MDNDNLLPDSSSSYLDAPASGSARRIDFGEKFIHRLLQPHQKWMILNASQLPSLLASVRFSERLAYLQKQLRAYALSATHYIHAHPFETVFALLCIVVLTTVPVILPAIGFTSTGPVAGSLAAIWQSSIGLVAAGSPFAFLQSAAMGSAAAGWIYGAGAAGLGILGAKRARGWWKRRGEGGGVDKEEDEG
ncbi:hypothetical protein MMC13_004936 [Lambiella insularis]|nr:hypothetical protein [Lambiella insularis]